MLKQKQQHEKCDQKPMFCYIFRKVQISFELCKSKMYKNNMR